MLFFAVGTSNSLFFFFFSCFVKDADMIFSPDLLFFFEKTAPLLEQDSSIWCVSSWNDNGFNYLVTG
jgi:hypothetical protein